MGNFMAGVTGQIKLSDRVALTGISQLSLTQHKIKLLTVHFALTKDFKGFFLMVLLV
jgi:hypothetical protein